MTPEDIIRAWKDETYHLSLSAEEREHLPQNPVGPIELPNELLSAVVGGRGENEMLYPVTQYNPGDPLCASQEMGCTKGGSCDFMCTKPIFSYGGSCGCWFTV